MIMIIKDGMKVCAGDWNTVNDYLFSFVLFLFPVFLFFSFRIPLSDADVKSTLGIEINVTSSFFSFLFVSRRPSFRMLAVTPRRHRGKRNTPAKKGNYTPFNIPSKTP